MSVQSADVPPGQFVQEAKCGPGEFATGGGYSASSEAFTISESEAGDRKWTVAGINTANGSEKFIVEAICVTVSEPSVTSS